ncbi:hypothetical protein LDENG_00267130 [Lucifuga dentata]|nr:hypothetical protein LDENG_00267130 [Lucifuga dentata]
MRFLSFKITSDLLCLFLTLLWCFSESSASSSDMISAAANTTVTTSPTAANTTAATSPSTTKPSTTTPSTAPLTAKPPPENVDNVMVMAQNESSITLKWEKVNNISTYILLYNNGAATRDQINASSQDTTVTHVVSSLTSGRQYKFILFTVSEEINSTGYPFEAVTAPRNADEFKSVGQTETSITLQWSKVEDILRYQLEFSGNVTNVNATTHTISELTARKKYNFALFTVFENVRSSGVSITAVTAPQNTEVTVLTQNESSVTLTWEKVNGISTYILQYNNGNITENITTSANETAAVKHSVSPLSAGTKYKFTLFTVFEYVRSSGANISAVTAPRKVVNVTVLAQNESSITLKWEKVNDISRYILLIDNGAHIQINASSPNASVTHVVSSLNSGRKYKFTLVSVFEGVNSTGYVFEAVTVPQNVQKVNVLRRDESSITLQWEKFNNISTYTLQYYDNGKVTEKNIAESDKKNTVEYLVVPLTAGTKYDFTLFTVFEYVSSSGFNITTVTIINCSSVPWCVTNSSIHGVIDGLFSNATASNGLGIVASPAGWNVSFTGLYAGSTYEVSLVYEINSESLLQCRHNVTILPPDLKAHCAYWAAGYSVLVKWDKPDGVWTAVEVNVKGETHRVDKNGEQQIIINGFQPAKSYEVSVASLSGTLRSENSDSFTCHTDPRGVIAGAVLAVLLFCLLLALAVFIWQKRPDIISRKKSFTGGFKLSNKTLKAIPVAQFTNHFYQLSADQNRGYSKEYESLTPVGTEQTQRAASNPENKVKNRFINVLPYDWCRVKLNTTIHNEIADYINASYMPGYRTNREYIAAQGPLPSTVSDFWRMVWEQSVKGIVMVTNCTEGGRVKCEQYWPSDKTPCLYGDLLVTTKSEQEEPNWTLREFGVKHKKTSEQRTVKHFHFTAWPDHGVPEGTEALIRFRGLLRWHIESEGTQTPTVVHCSAGVGRTGTIITLDVLLQQLEKERVVGIKAFVHKMRLNRPHMVQTESQYIFLHQCIMNFLETEKSQENIYENSDMIYANATALRGFHSTNA